MGSGAQDGPHYSVGAGSDAVGLFLGVAVRVHQLQDYIVGLLVENRDLHVFLSGEGELVSFRQVGGGQYAGSVRVSVAQRAQIDSVDDPEDLRKAVHGAGQRGHVVVAAGGKRAYARICVCA